MTPAAPGNAEDTGVTVNLDRIDKFNHSVTLLFGKFAEILLKVALAERASPLRYRDCFKFRVN